MGNHRGIKENKERYLYGHCIIQNRVIYFEAKYRAVSVSQARYYLCLGLREFFKSSDFLEPQIYASGTFPSTLLSFRRSLPTNGVRCFYDCNYIYKMDKNINLGFTNAYHTNGCTDEQIKNTCRDYVLEVVENNKEAGKIRNDELANQIECCGFKVHRSDIGMIQMYPYIIYDKYDKVVLSTDYTREVLRFRNYIKRKKIRDGILKD